MERRRYLAALGAMTVAGMAGCSESQQTNELDTPHTTRTETTQPTPQSSDAPAQQTRSQSNTLEANYAPLTRFAPAYFTAYSLQRSTIEYTKTRLDKLGIDDTVSLAVVAQQYPDGAIIDTDTVQRTTLSPGTNRITLTHSLSIPTDTPFLLSVVAFPPRYSYLEADAQNQTTRLCETDRLQIQNSDLVKDPLLRHPETTSTERYKRLSAEGTFIIMVKTGLGTFGTSVLKHPYYVMNAKRAKGTEAAIRGAIEEGRASELAHFIHAEATARNHTTPVDRLRFALRVVQNIPTTTTGSGFDTNAKYPIETFVEGRGDSEDTTILLAAILAEPPYDYDIATLKLPPIHQEHAALGIADPPGSRSGEYFTGENEIYYYIETTTPGMAIGDIPAEYAETKARITSVP